jgi:uncharacterized protein (DUF1697 family)
MALVVFLRGVNVGGHRTFRPAELAKQLADLDVVNIGAAGTFVVRQPVAQARLRAELTSRLPFDAAIVTCRGRDILRLMSQRHFEDQPVRPDIVRFLSILSKSPRSTPSTPVSFPASGKWLVRVLAREHRFVFGVYRRQMKAIGYLGEIDRFFGTPATTRNWNTITAVAKVVGNGQTRPTGKQSLDMRGIRELLPNKPMQRTAFGRR